MRSRKWPNLHILCILLLAVTTFQMGHCQNNTGHVASDSEEVKKKDPIQKGMEPLYVMTNTFLGVVQPESKGSIILELVTDTKNIESSNWQMYAKHYVGFLVCAAIGLVFFILMPIIGLCFCCCRCCGNCGGAEKPMKSKHDKCLRVTCSILFVVVNVLIMAGMICAFVTNELLRMQTSQETTALVPTVIDNIHRLDRFKDITINEVRTDVVDRVQLEINNVIGIFNSMPSDTQTNISKALQAEQVLNEAKALADRTQSIYDSLATIDMDRTQLISQGNTLSNSVIGFKSDTQSTLNSLSTACNTECNNLKTKINSLTAADYSGVPSVTDQKDAVKGVLDGDLKGKINTGEEGLNDISTEVSSKTQSTVDDSKNSLGEVNTNVQSNVDKFEQDLKQKVSLNTTIKKIEEYQDDVEKYGDYRFYIGIGLACILLLILLFNILGLLFGICGEPAYEDAGTCNKGVGANLLLAGVGFTFLFAWILMLVVLLLFVVGGLLQTEACRIIVNVEDSKAITTLDNFLSKNVFEDSSINFQFSETLSGCKADDSLYKVLQLDNIVNLTKVLDINDYNVKQEIDKLKTISFTIPNLDIYTTDMAAALDDLKRARLDDISFDAISNSLSVANTDPTLSSIQADLTNYANTLTGSDKADVQARARQAGNIDEAQVTTTKSKLATESNKLKLLIKGNDNAGTFVNQINNLQTSLTNVEDRVRANVVNLMFTIVADKANELVSSFTAFLTEVANSLQNDIGKCRPVYTALDTSIIAVCESTLMPFNGFWFSVGWCLIFLVPSLICAVKLAGLYRKYEDFEADNGKSFDDPRNMGNGANGKHNTGYERDEYTASRSGNYRYNPQNYDPGYQHQNRSYPNAPSSTPPNPPHYYNNHSNRRFDY